MGSSRASTPAGRRRATRSASGAAATPKRRTTPKRPAKQASTARKAPRKRNPPKARKSPPKPKQAPAKARQAVGLRSRVPQAIVIAAAVLGLVAAGYQLWLRNSSLVAVDEVSVAGIDGPEQDQVEAALTKAAREMTTLNVDEDALRAAVAGFPTVVDVSADADFPHGLAITVAERPPVLIATAGGQSLPVAGDGTGLAGVDVDKGKLPSIGVDELPARGKLTGDTLEIALLMGAAPEPLRELVEELSIGGPEGIQVVLRGEIPVYFGGSDRADEKWAAAAALLADPAIEFLTYVDVRVPERPAVGGAAPAVTDSTTETTEPETQTTPTTP